MLTAQLFGGSSEIILYLDDELTPGIKPALLQRLEMHSLRLIKFGPHALVATLGVLRKSERSG